MSEEQVLDPEQEKAVRAILRYLRRKDWSESPVGYRDRAGRWYPRDEEWRPCCDKIRRPSRAWPWTLAQHCRTLEHCCALEGADPKLARKLLSKVKKVQDIASLLRSS